MDEIVSILGFGFGILSRAEGTPIPVTLVMLNAGLIHRVGPFRAYVRFARHLAARGVDVFRFDLPRVGDGPAGGAPVNAMVAAVLDTLERETGARRFVLGGICSAADTAWRIAQDEPRVVGVWLFDGFAHRGRWFRYARLRKALARPFWYSTRLARKLLGGARGTAGAPDTDVAMIRDWPEPAAFRRQTRELLARGVRILAMYTGGVSKYLMHPRQIDETFGGRHKGLQVGYWPGFDHTLMSPDDRDQVMAELGDWFELFRERPVSVAAEQPAEAPVCIGVQSEGGCLGMGTKGRDARAVTAAP